jgi:tetratricopeptide (TPR) repeat protein
VESPFDSDLDPRSRRRLESFSVDPTDVAGFRLLEEELFLAGSWTLLAGVYDARLSVLDASSPEWRELLFRLGELLESRVCDAEAACRRYEELLRVAPQDARALRQLRCLHTREGALTAALQIAEVEESLPLDPPERARVLAEGGQLWLLVGEPGEGESRLREALQLDARCEPALAGLAELAEQSGDVEEAIRLQLLRLEEQPGASKAETLECLAQLQPERARQHLREALRCDRDRRSAIESLLELEIEARAWPRVSELRLALWELSRDPEQRREVARSATREQLERAGDAGCAAEWLDRIEDASDADPELHDLRARVYRCTDRPEQVIQALEQLVTLEGPTPERLLELSTLHERASRHARALDWLQALLEREPRNPEALAVADRCLRELGRHAELAELVELRLDLARDDAARVELWVELGDLQAGPLDDRQAAEQAYRRAVELDASSPLANERLMQLLRKQDQPEQLAVALESRAQELAERPGAAELWCELAELRLERLDDSMGARAAFCAALEREPGSTRAIAGLHRVALETEDPAWLLEACERELGLELSDERRVQVLACAVEAAEAFGDLLGARNAAEAWVELAPDASSFGMLARIAREADDPACERRALEALIDVGGSATPERAALLARLGDLTLDSADPAAVERAASFYRESLRLAPDPERRRQLIDLYRALDQRPEMADELRSALADAEGDAARPCCST